MILRKIVCQKAKQRMRNGIMKTIDLCCGIGGIRRGFELAGDFENVLSAEKDEYACRTYQHLFGDDPRNDVTDETFKELVLGMEYDVLLAGFPCQTFSRIGLRQGFRDVTKGTIFFDIAEIIDQTMPKVVFLENVENLVSHDGGKTFKIIINTLENELNYHVIGVERDDDGKLRYDKKSFIRNTKNFGLPQNRPRVYIVAFSRDYFGKHVDLLPRETPTQGRKEIFHSVLDILDTTVPARFFLSSGFLTTLEEHRVRQRSNGNGFGYQIVNDASIDRPLAHTILATGGSGKERNLIYDPVNGRDIVGTEVSGKKTPINDKCIRTMTPEEWGRLQGFIGYAFLDENENETFSFPEKMSNQQKFKQFGNSVSIPLIEEMALFIKDCVTLMESEFSEEEKEHYKIPGAMLRVQNGLRKLLKNEKPKTIEKCCQLVSEIGLCNGFRAEDIEMALGQSNVTAYNYLHRLERAKCVELDNDGYKLRTEKKKFTLEM